MEDVELKMTIELDQREASLLYAALTALINDEAPPAFAELREKIWAAMEAAGMWQ